MQNAICKYCKKEVAFDASRCPHCQGDLRSWPARHKLLTILGAFILLIILAANLGKSQQPADQETSLSDTDPQAEPETPTRPKEEAQKELDELISLGKQAGLVVSYEFSDKASVVYVGDVWYTQTVEFKKDFMAKIAMLKMEITGFKRFQVLDAYSNEKVGEVTGVTGSLEVYK